MATLSSRPRPKGRSQADSPRSSLREAHKELTRSRIVAALAELISKPRRLEEMRNRAYRYATNSLSWETATERYREAVRTIARIVGGGRSRQPESSRGG